MTEDIRHIRYIARRAEPEALGSGSSYHDAAATADEAEAFRLLAEHGRNELVRVSRVDGILRRSYWDPSSGTWDTPWRAPAGGKEGTA